MPETKRAGQFQVIFNRMFAGIEARRLKSLRVLVAAVGNNPPRSSLARQFDKTRMAFKHQRPIQVQVPKCAMDAPFLWTQPGRKVPARNRNGLVNVRIESNHVQGGG